MRTSPGWFNWQGNVLLINIHVLTRAKTDEISGIHANRLRVRIKSPPVDGKANKQLLSFFAKEFGVAKSNTKIIRGKLGRDKTIAVYDSAKRPDWFNNLSKACAEINP